MDIEHKLDLIQQIHREQEENERYIYSNARYRNNKYRFSDSDVFDYRNYGDNSQIVQQGSMFASFRLRLLLAVVLFLCFFVMEKKEIEFKGIGCREIVEYIDSNIVVEDLRALISL